MHIYRDLCMKMELTRFNLNIWQILLLISIPILFVLNLYMIQKGQSYTGYRDMLFFYGYHDLNILIPIAIFAITFPLICLIIYKSPPQNWAILKNTKVFAACLVLLTLASQIFFLRIPETNPDFTRYIQHAQIFTDYGPLYYFDQWGSAFSTHVDLPTGSLPFGILFMIFGENRLIIQIFSVIIVITTAYLIFLLGNKIFSKKCGIISALLFLSFPFLLTQIPLLLVDIVSMFYLTAFAYFAYCYLEEGNVGTLLLSGALFFLAAFSKILAPLFMLGIVLGLLIVTTVKYDTIQPYLRLSLLFFVSLIPSVIYFIHLSHLFSGTILTHINRIYSLPIDWTVLCAGLVVASIVLAASPLFISVAKKAILRSRLRVECPHLDIILIGIVYCILFALLFFDFGRSHFYLRSLPIAVGIIPALLALISIGSVIRKRELMAVPLILWLIIPILFMPNTMYKYLQPAYPAIALLCGLTVCWVKDLRIQKYITVGAILMGLIIALCVFYPMCMTHSQNNVQNSVEYLDSVGLENQEFQVIYIPTTERFQQRINLFIAHIPLWFGYYGHPQMNYAISTIHNQSQYQNLIDECLENDFPYLMIISDASRIDDDILPPSILNHYSVLRIYNRGYHAAYWFNTQQVIILKNNYHVSSEISFKDAGILDDKVYLGEITFHDPALAHYEPPIFISLRFENVSNRFVIYDWYNQSFHRAGPIYKISPGSQTVVHAISRPTNQIRLDLHELDKKPLGIREISISNSTRSISTLRLS